MQFVKKNDLTNEWERKCLKHANDMFEKVSILLNVEKYRTLHKISIKAFYCKMSIRYKNGFATENIYLY